MQVERFKITNRFVPCILVALGGLMVIVLAIGPKVLGFKPGEDYRCSRAMKICSTTSFGGEVKPAEPCKILRHVKDPYGMADTS
jgi:hypothetical protein